MSTPQLNFQIIDLTPENIANYGVCGYKDVNKHEELRRKIEWVKKYNPKGLRIKAVIAEDGSYQGMLEYIPGEFAHRPVSAKEYIFIHCVFVGFKKEYKSKGLASALLDICIAESREACKKGVAVVTRKGSFMADKDFFLRKGFISVDKADPDFELLVFKFDNAAENPVFIKTSASQYNEGITIMRSAQCPYSVKNVDAIIKTAEKMGLHPNLIEIEDANQAQQSPCAFGTFCIIKNGKVISQHPISNTRFENIIRTGK